MDTQPVVFLLDDDPSVLQALGRLLQASGFATRSWTSAVEFLETHDPESPGCLIVDFLMPEMTGLELYDALLRDSSHRPIIFISGQGNISMSVQAMKAGAVTFLSKPVRAAELLAAVSEAIAKDAAARAIRRRRDAAAQRIETLTPRERQVIELLAKGMLNKQVAAALGIAEKTIKVHRGRAMEKLELRSVVALLDLLNRASLGGKHDSPALPARPSAEIRA
ncbi:MAG: response regulator [Steroidobacteraceae bacterium]